MIEQNNIDSPAPENAIDHWQINVDQEPVLPDRTEIGYTTCHEGASVGWNGLTIGKFQVTSDWLTAGLKIDVNLKLLDQLWLLLRSFADTFRC